MTETAEPSDEQVIAIAKLYGNYIEGHGWTGFGPSPEAISEALTRFDPAVRDRVTYPDNLISHRASWLKAMDRLIEIEPVTGQPDEDERGFWTHEKNAMLAMYADIDRTSPPEPASGLPERCPDCGLHWGHHPPAILFGSEHVRCVECKLIWVPTPPAKEPQ